MENSSRAFLDAVSKSMRQIRQAVGTNVVDTKLLTYAEKLQYEGYLRRQETNEAIQQLAKSGTSVRQIVRQTGHSRKPVRDVLRGQRLDVFRTRPSTLDSWLPWLNERWEAGSRNALALWREMRTEGFVGQPRIVSQWAQRRCLAEKAGQSGLMHTPSARVLARLMTSAQDGLGKSEAILVASFANGVGKDLIAVRNAIISPWSNGQTEGQITRLKLIKRQMYGRAKLDLLRARVVGV